LLSFATFSNIKLYQMYINSAFKNGYIGKDDFILVQIYVGI